MARPREGGEEAEYFSEKDDLYQDQCLLEEIRGWDEAAIARLEPLICFEDYVFAEGPPPSKAAVE